MSNPMLREARSSPYIGASMPTPEMAASARPESASDAKSANKVTMQNAASAEHFERLKELVQFSAGSSTSLLAELDGAFYANANNADGGGGGRRNTAERKAESVDNLASSVAEPIAGGCPLVRHQPEAESCNSINSVAATAGSVSPTLVETTNLRSAAKQHCSETNLHNGIGRDIGFRVLEKCCSVELSPAKVMIPPSRLARTKEMPNIADVDDYEGISEGN